MSHPKDLLERKCLSEYCQTVHGYAKVKEGVKIFFHLLFFGPRAVSDGVELVRGLTDLKVHILTFESVEKYKEALIENFFDGAKTLDLYAEHKYPQPEETFSRIEDMICDYFPEPLKTIRTSLPKAKFLIETLEMFGTPLTSLLLIAQGDKKFYLHVFEEELMVQRVVSRASGHIAPSF
ncbi:MAG: hypothetical protein U1D31_01420 [Patescibacteria group bacterium]|nr:hypothetical protein [bacterium]MDZ4240767.1 hypothetical protein [Patescibacteria group bacterium]